MGYSLGLLPGPHDPSTQRLPRHVTSLAAISHSAKPSVQPCTGHSRSPLKAHEDWLLHLVAKEPDLTLEEIRKRLRREKKLGVAVSSVWRFYDRHEITFKKSPPCV